MRKIWRVPPRTHCRLLEHLYGSSGIEYELFGRFTLLYRFICNSKNLCTRLCSMLCKTSMNRRQLCAKLNIGGECLNEYSKSKLIKLYDYNDKCKTDGSALKELSLVRDGILNIDIDLMMMMIYIASLICYA